MSRHVSVVRLSSKGQLVIPAAVRRKLGLTNGQVLAVRTGAGREIVLTPAEEDARGIDSMLERARSWVAAGQRDLVAELHDRRRRDRVRDAAKR